MPRGPWLFFYEGAPLYSTGHSVLEISETGSFSLMQQGGTSTDLCAALA